jgi:hypothetical protein
VLVRFENHLDENPLVLDRQDFGAPDWSFLTRLHNGHTTRDSFELRPAKRREFVVDFTRYQDGSPTTKGDVIYLTDVMKMPDGRMWSTSSRASADPDYKVPVMRIVIGDNAPDDSRIPTGLPAPAAAEQLEEHARQPPDLRGEARQRGPPPRAPAMRGGRLGPGGRAEVRQVAERGSPGARRQMTPRCCRYRKAAIPGSTGSQ